MQILSKQEMYDADQYTIQTMGMPDEMLMENAGQAMTAKLLPYLKLKDYIVVLVGVGNNGGDGIVIARRLRNLGYCVQLVLIPQKEKLKGAALWHCNLYQKHYPIQQAASVQAEISRADWIVDALFGIGVHGNICEPYDTIIHQINRSHARVFSVDIPSGVGADGEVCNAAVYADVTAAVAYPKLSTFLYPAAQYYGVCSVVDIGIPKKACANAVDRRTWQFEDFSETLPIRKPNAHKGTQGRVLIIGGSKNMIGAPALCAKACLTAGIGLLQLAVPHALRFAVSALVPEATYLSCEEKDDILCDVQIPEKIQVIACGPGLSRCLHAKRVVEKVMQSKVPVVLDADALYFFPFLLEQVKMRACVTVLTPHMGEMAQLCDCSVKHVEENRFKIAREKAVEWGCVVVLKGPYTIISFPNGQQCVNTSGNAGMAKGGSGDVLTGIIAAFLVNCKNLPNAVCNAVYAHGAAADLLLQSEKTMRDLTASEIISALPKVFYQAETDAKRKHMEQNKV